MIDYKNGLIYYIMHEATDNLYIGSTTGFDSRKYVHKHRCHNKESEYYSSTLYTTIRNNGGWGSWSMGILQMYPCNSRNELQQYERFLINELGANLNASLPSTRNDKYKEL